MPTATWYHERCYAQRILSQCYQALNKSKESLDSARNAVKEAENLRESWVNLAEICQKQSKWRESFYAATQALSITYRDYAYTSDESVWGAKPYDLAAIAAHYLGYKEQARELGMEAWTRDMANPRLKTNLEWYSK
jgi:tetratricopeptide (TPR) repeat protein